MYTIELQITIINSKQSENAGVIEDHMRADRKSESFKLIFVSKTTSKLHTNTQY
jgi:hypothetical protein